MDSLRPLCVKDVLVQDSWDIQALCDFLPSDALQWVLSTPLHLSTDEDIIVWEPTQSGHFTLASAQEEHRPKLRAYNPLHFLWNPGIPFRVSFFMWRLLNVLLPFPEVLQRLGFHMVSKCPHCQSEDSIDHCFYRCFLAQHLWKYFAQLLRFPLHYIADGFYAFLRSFWESSNDHSADAFRFLALLPLAICWSLWRIRNEALYDARISDLSQAIFYATSMLSSFTLRKPLSISTATQQQFHLLQGLHFRHIQRHINVVYWVRPSQMALKLNIDGSALHNPGHAGGGLILRDSKGDILSAESHYFGILTSVEAEAKTLLYGLKFCARNALTGLQVETDSKLLLDCVQGRAHWPWKLLMDSKDILNLLAQTQCVVYHTYRESNAVVDALAKLASHSRCSASFTTSSMPRRILRLARMDQLSFPYVRSKLS